MGAVTMFYPTCVSLEATYFQEIGEPPINETNTSMGGTWSVWDGMLLDMVLKNLMKKQGEKKL
jgi:hypothetical protein